MKTIDEEGHKYLRFLEYDKVKEKEMQTEFVRERNGKKKPKAINSWAVATMRYGAGVLESRVDELNELDKKTRKLLTMHKGLQRKCDVDRLYVNRKHGGKGLMRCESTVRSEKNNLG